jgi:hypothetical protein
MIKFFCDESGSNDTPFMCVSGYLIDSSVEHQFDLDWRMALDRFGISHFHMVDMAHRRGDFRGMNDIDRTSLAKNLIEIIHGYTIRGIGVISPVKDYRDNFPFHPNMPNIYNFLMWKCFQGAFYWLEENNQHRAMTFIVESGHPKMASANRVQALALELARQEHGLELSHAFVEKKESAVLQAADMFAWHVLKDKRNNIERRPRRRDYMALISNGEHRVAFFDKEQIVRVREQLAREGAWGV